MACSCFPCFKENVVATCKIGSFLCSLDNLFQKNVIVLFFGNQRKEFLEDLVKYRNRKRHRFLAAAILLFIDKIIIN